MEFHVWFPQPMRSNHPLSRQVTALLQAGADGCPAGDREARRRFKWVLHKPNVCSTMCDMKTSAVTIRMEVDLKRQLSKMCKQTGRSQSEVVRGALKRQFAIIRFREIRRRVLPLAEARGYITDEDVFRDVS